MLDKGKVKELGGEVKALERNLTKLQKQLSKLTSKSEPKAEVVSDGELPADEASVEELDITSEIELEEARSRKGKDVKKVVKKDEEVLNESFLKMQKMAGVITEAQYNSKKKALVENQLNENTKHSELKPLEDILLKNGYKFIGDNIGFSDKATYKKEANKINTYEISLFKDYLDKYPVRILYFVGEDFTFSNGEKMNRGQADIRYNSIEDAKKDLEGISVINTTKQI